MPNIPPLSLHLNPDLEEVVVTLLAGRNNRPVARQKRLTPEDGVGALGRLRCGELRRPGDDRRVAVDGDRRAEHVVDVRRVRARHVVLPHLQVVARRVPLARRLRERRGEVAAELGRVGRKLRRPRVGHRGGSARDLRDHHHEPRGLRDRLAAVLRHRLVRLHVAEVHGPLLRHALHVWRYPAVRVLVDMYLQAFVRTARIVPRLAETRLVRIGRAIDPWRVPPEIDVAERVALLEAPFAEMRERRRQCHRRQIVAIGEIGLEDLTDGEIATFKRQLDIADETKSKVIIHTPRKNKREVLAEILDILPNHLDEKQAVIDHINPDVIKDVANTDYMLGLTVQPQKMEKEDAIAILDEYGFDNFLLNSDISNKPSDPLSVPKTIRELQRLGYENSEIEKVSHKNAMKFFKI